MENMFYHPRDLNEEGLDNAYHYNDNKGTVMINPTSQLLRKSTQGLLAGSAIMMGVLNPSPAKAQGVVNANETIDFSAVANQVYGTGNGFPNGSVITGSITLNPYNLLLLAGNSTGGAKYSSSTALVSETINGNTSTYQGIQIVVLPNTSDINNTPADYLGFTWGPNYNDVIGINDPVGAAGGSSLNSFQTMVTLGLAGAIPVDGDNGIGTGYDASGNNGIGGSLTSFQLDPVSTPEPSTIAMGTLGAAGLLALRRMRGIKKNEPALNR
jgi:hypothetical protein